MNAKGAGLTAVCCVCAGGGAERGEGCLHSVAVFSLFTLVRGVTSCTRRACGRVTCAGDGARRCVRSLGVALSAVVVALGSDIS